MPHVCECTSVATRVKAFWHSLLYNKKESDALWSWSSFYRGEDRDRSSF